jgi:hypothetical protein
MVGLSFIIFISQFLLIDVDVGVSVPFLLLVLLSISITGFIILCISWAARPFFLNRKRPDLSSLSLFL